MRRADGGFSLLEVLVALAIFSLAALALVNLAAQNSRTAAVLEERAYAQIVAENRIVEVMPFWPSVGEATGVETQAGRRWRWTRRISATADAEVVRIDVAVSRDGSPQSLASLTAFRGRR